MPAAGRAGVMTNRGLSGDEKRPALVDARWLAPVPEDADAGAASVLSMPAPLALRLLRLGRVGPGDTVLVQSAAGTIGHLAVQLAGHLGAARVIGEPCRSSVASKVRAPRRRFVMCTNSFFPGARKLQS